MSAAAADAIQEARIRDLIFQWDVYYILTEPVPGRYCRIKNDLYQVRNPGLNGNPSLSAWPPHLIDSDPAVLAAVEHYFLTRCWVGNAIYPAWEVRMFCGIYNTGKKLGFTPRHNPKNPTTPPSPLQAKFQEEGIAAGEADVVASGAKPPTVKKPPVYW